MRRTPRSAKASLVLGILIAVVVAGTSNAYSLGSSEPSRRAFLQRAASSAAVAVVGAGSATILPSTAPLPAQAAAPQIFETPNGIKYAVLIPPKDKSASPPAKGDLVAIEYTGYLTDGTVFDSTHAEGKKNALLFQLGGNAVIDGINEMIENMSVGTKVQAIIPPGLAFGDKGLCLESGECLIKPKSTLVYDIALKRASIPPP